MANSKTKPRKTGTTTLRHVWLAGLGAASLLRRDAVDIGGRVITEALRLQGQARDAGARTRSKLASAASGPLGSIIAAFEDGIGTRFAPAMRKLALRPHATPGAGRKPVQSGRTRRAPARQSRRATRSG